MGMIKEKIKNLINEAMGVDDFEINLSRPTRVELGDYSTNVAFELARREKTSPREVAERLVARIMLSKPDEIEKIEVAGGGFINFYLSNGFLQEQIGVMAHDDHYGLGDSLKGETIMVEFTDPNPFKLFHIGHLMSNTIGEAISRLHEAVGAKIIRANYQGDVGLHVAKAIWAMLDDQAMPDQNASLEEKASYLGKMYSSGASAFEENEELKEKIKKINDKIYSRSDGEINKVYDIGRVWSLEYFEEIYKKLGTKFDRYFFESETAKDGLEIVTKNSALIRKNLSFTRLISLSS